MEKVSTRGVSKTKKNGRSKYVSRIQVNGRVVQLGLYDTAKEAGLAYDLHIVRNGLSRKTNYLKKK